MMSLRCFQLASLRNLQPGLEPCCSLFFIKSTQIEEPYSTHLSPAYVAAAHRPGIIVFCLIKEGTDVEVAEFGPVKVLFGSLTIQNSIKFPCRMEIWRVLL